VIATMSERRFVIRAALLLAVLAMAALTVAPAADAKRFGANLKKRKANSTRTCRTVSGPDAFGNPFFYPSGAKTCTWFTIARRYNTSREGTIVPSNRGVITSARVKVGRKTGKMRFVLLKAIAERPPGGYHSNQACCTLVKRTRAFRPRRHRVTTKRMRWRMHGFSAYDPSTGLTTTSYYVLAISVLSPNTPVPLQDTHRYGSLDGPGSTAFFPALKRKQERTGIGQFGWIALINGTYHR
jgi:hypothetical protein